jgi:1,4-alpha-glucan branching enzyme
VKRREMEYSQGAGVLKSAGGLRFRVWAPAATRSVELVLYGGGVADGKGRSASENLVGNSGASGAGNEPGERARIRLTADTLSAGGSGTSRTGAGAGGGGGGGGRGYWSVVVPPNQGGAVGALYKYSIDGAPPVPDPVARFQPFGVHGPSQVVEAQHFPWNDDSWPGIVAPQSLVLYELHVGTFTSEGTFRAAQTKLPYLKELGVNAIELLPVADFPGTLRRDRAFLLASETLSCPA